MGKLEERNKINVRRSKIQEAILLTIASGGRLGSELIVNQALDSLLGLDLSNSSRKNWIVRSAASRLQKKGLVIFENKYYKLTKDGENILKSWQKFHYKIKKPKKWDQKWRVIIFDIPEKKKRARNQIRQVLAEAGFKRLQDSVWVYPYDCEDVIGLLKTDLNVGKETLYMIVDQIENDRFLREDFGLI